MMGESYTICDPYLFTMSTWLKGDEVDREISEGARAFRRDERARFRARGAAHTVRRS